MRNKLAIGWLLAVAILLSIQWIRQSKEAHVKSPAPPTQILAGTPLNPVPVLLPVQIRSEGDRTCWTWKTGGALAFLRPRAGNDAIFLDPAGARNSAFKEGTLFLNLDAQADSLTGSDAGFPAGDAARSVGVWAATKTKAHSGLFDYGTEGAEARFSLMSGDDVFFFSDLGHDFYGKTRVSDGHWHLAIITYDGALLRLYVDGVLDASKEVVLRTASSGKFSIGSNAGREGFSGAIRDPFICNYVLPEADIATMSRRKPADGRALP